jgi:hypothetical protein
MAIETDIHTAARPSDSQKEDEDAAAPTAPRADDNRIESHTLARNDSADARHLLIAEAAYRRAQERGFAAGEDWQDWFAAEREIDGLLDPDL